MIKDLSTLKVPVIARSALSSTYPSVFIRQGVELFACGVAWLVMNAAAIFICMWVKLKLNKQLEKCMASINASLMKHKIILGLDDRGRLSCHKVNLCFIYFDPADCCVSVHPLALKYSRMSS